MITMVLLPTFFEGGWYCYLVLQEFTTSLSSKCWNVWLFFFLSVKQKIRYQPQRKRKILFSEDEQFIDHTFDAVQWLTLFKIQNKTKLKEIKVTD